MNGAPMLGLTLAILCATTVLGYDLFMASSFYYNVGEMGYITWLILAVAICLEIGATRLKKAQCVAV